MASRSSFLRGSIQSHFVLTNRSFPFKRPIRGDRSIARLSPGNMGKHEPQSRRKGLFAGHFARHGS